MVGHNRNLTQIHNAFVFFFFFFFFFFFLFAKRQCNRFSEQRGGLPDIDFWSRKNRPSLLLNDNRTNYLIAANDIDGHGRDGRVCVY